MRINPLRWMKSILSSTPVLLSSDRDARCVSKRSTNDTDSCIWSFFVITQIEKKKITIWNVCSQLINTSALVLAVQRAENAKKTKEEVSNEVFYWYQCHFKGLGIGTGILFFKQCSAPASGEQSLHIFYTSKTSPATNVHIYYQHNLFWKTLALFYILSYCLKVLWNNQNQKRPYPVCGTRRQAQWFPWKTSVFTNGSQIYEGRLINLWPRVEEDEFYSSRSMHYFLTLHSQTITQINMRMDKWA